MFGISGNRLTLMAVLISMLFTIGCQSEVDNNEVKTYFENGKLKLLERFEGSGNERGKIYEEQYYENGILRMKGAFKNNQRHGDWKVWYASGKLWSEGTYQSGERQGFSRAYYESGLIRMEGDYKDDEQVGLWLFWDEEGNLIHKEEFK